MARTKLEVFVAVDSEGQYEVALDADDVAERHADNNGISGSLAVYRLTVDVELPSPISVEVTIPEGAQPVAIVAAE